jgi:aspartate 1-decarboxylase
MVDSPPPPNTANGLVGAWSVIPDAGPAPAPYWLGVGSLDELDASADGHGQEDERQNDEEQEQAGEDAAHRQEELLHGATTWSGHGPGHGHTDHRRPGLPSNERRVTRNAAQHRRWCAATQQSEIDALGRNPYMSGLRAGAYRPASCPDRTPHAGHLMKAKLHRATVTQADLDYEGSIAIDADLLDAAGIFPHEQVDVLNITNGARFTTYAIEAPRGSKVIGVNGAAARLVQKNDKVIVVTYGQTAAGRSPPVVADRGAAGRPQQHQARRLISSLPGRLGQIAPVTPCPIRGSSRE